MQCCNPISLPMPQYIVLFKGDDSNFLINQSISIKLDTTVDLSGYKAHFRFLGYQIDFDEIPEDHILPISFPKEETSKFPICTSDARLWLEDVNGKIRTVANRIHIVVTNSVPEAYFNEKQQAITVTITGSGFRPFTQEDIFDMECNDWDFRKALAKVWKSLGGSVLNED